MKTTDQIAAKCGNELWGQRNKLTAVTFIKRIQAAIEKAVNGDGIKVRGRSG